MLAYVVCAVVWGTTWFAIRVCIGAGGYPTMPAAALRFTIAIAVLLPMAAVGLARPGPRNRRQLLWLAGAGLLNALGYGLVYSGEEHVSGALAAVLFGTEPLAVALMVTVTRTEHVRRSDVIGAIIALLGVGVIFWDRLDVSRDQAAGVGLILLAVIVSGAYAVIVKREASGMHPLASAAVFLTVTTVALWVFVLASGWQPLPWPPPVKPTIALLYLAIFGSVIAFATYFYLLSRVNLMASSSLVFVLPIIALFVDSIWEEDVVLHGRTYLGIAITMAGVLFSVWLRPRAVAPVIEA